MKWRHKLNLLNKNFVSGLTVFLFNQILRGRSQFHPKLRVWSQNLSIQLKLRGWSHNFSIQLHLRVWSHIFSIQNKSSWVVLNSQLNLRGWSLFERKLRGWPGGLVLLLHLLINMFVLEAFVFLLLPFRVLEFS